MNRKSIVLLCLLVFGIGLLTGLAISTNHVSAAEQISQGGKSSNWQVKLDAMREVNITYQVTDNEYRNINCSILGQVNNLGAEFIKFNGFLALQDNAGFITYIPPDSVRSIQTHQPMAEASDTP